MIDGLLRGVGLFMISPSPTMATSRHPVPAACAAANCPVAAIVVRCHSSRSVRVLLRKGGGTALYPTLRRAGEVNLGLLSC
jgi:hypothetical protein